MYVQYAPSNRKTLRVHTQPLPDDTFVSMGHLSKRKLDNQTPPIHNKRKGTSAPPLHKSRLGPQRSKLESPIPLSDSVSIIDAQDKYRWWNSSSLTDQSNPPTAINNSESTTIPTSNIEQPKIPLPPPIAIASTIFRKTAPFIFKNELFRLAVFLPNSLRMKKSRLNPQALPIPTCTKTFLLH